MERNIITTKDGSHTIAIPCLGVTYHSEHGAIRESLHIFIKAGLHPVIETARTGTIHVFEMGLGTGLNALLTLAETEKWQRPVHYTAVEMYPLGKKEIQTLNYPNRLNRPGLQAQFEHIHDCEWEADVAITSLFTIHKIKSDLASLATPAHVFQLVYFDAFDPAVQPELWTQEIFEKIGGMMTNTGMLMTYCSKGSVRRAMQSAGFAVEKLPGPPGKREIVRAYSLAGSTKSG